MSGEGGLPPRHGGYRPRVDGTGRQATTPAPPAPAGRGAASTLPDPMSGEGGLVEVHRAHGSVSGALIRRDGRLGVLCRCDHFMPTDDWRDAPDLHAEHQAAEVREWLAGGLDETRVGLALVGELPTDAEGHVAACGYDAEGCCGCLTLMPRMAAALRDLIGITEGGQS